MLFVADCYIEWQRVSIQNFSDNRCGGNSLPNIAADNRHRNLNAFDASGRRIIVFLESHCSNIVAEQMVVGAAGVQI